MTTQTPDWIFYQGRRYQLLNEVAQTGRLLTEWAVPCLMLSTDRHRGYVADYEIDANQLFIKRIEVADISDPEEEVQAEIASLMELLPPIEGVYPTAELLRHVFSAKAPDWKEERVPYYSIAYHLKYFYQISTQFTLLYREDNAFVGAFLMKPFPDEVVKISVEKGYVQEKKIITEELRVIQSGINASYEESRGREMGAEHDRIRNALHKQKQALLEEF